MSILPLYLAAGGALFMVVARLLAWVLSERVVDPAELTAISRRRKDLSAARGLPSERDGSGQPLSESSLDQDWTPKR